MSIPPMPPPAPGPATAVDPRIEVELLQGSDSWVGMDPVVDQLMDLLARHAPATPLIVGPSGSGRTAALRALATRLDRGPSPAPLERRHVHRVRAEVVIGAGRAVTLKELRDKVAGKGVIALDDLEVLMGLSAAGQDLELRGVIRSMLGRSDVPAVATIESVALLRLEQADPEMFAELSIVRLPTWDDVTLDTVARRRAPGLSRHHRVAIPIPVLVAARSIPRPDESRAHPGLLIDRLDAAATRAARRGVAKVDLSDLQLGEATEPRTALDPDRLVNQLRQHVRGQDHACRAVASRLSLTIAGLDLRPHRPEGVFLFIGPSGVGKTALAKSLAVEVFGSADRLVRIDMSEFAEDHTVSRIYGPPPGYIGSDQPDGWLTSKVRSAPQSVVLLDEIEKAHPDVWNAFLQVFDDGRLTDSAGRTVDFSGTVIVMTSNIGSRSFGRRSVGFRTSDEEAAVEHAVSDVLTTLKQTMAPELINRIDEIVVFHPLDREVIVEIARVEIAAAAASLAERGWRIEIEDRAIEGLALTDYDPAYGARHVLRNLERLVLQPLVRLGPGAYRGLWADQGIIDFGPLPDPVGIEPGQVTPDL